ncbi:MAG: hypothetical protein WD845_02095 [Pirellulales bacterium]
MAAVCLTTRASAGGETVQASSSRQARDEAVRAIPLDKLTPQDKKRVAATLSANGLYRRLPVQVTECDPDMYLFLVRHPEVVVNIWEVMKISNVALHRTGNDTFQATDGAGTLCDVKYCYSDHETQVIYAEGSYDGPLFKKPINARCVLLLKSGYVRETNGRYYVTSRMDTFMDIDHAGVEMLAKTMQPLVNRAADYNFVETAAFLSQISRTSEVNPLGVGRLSRKLTNLEPDVRERFAQLSLEVGHKARQREAIESTTGGGPGKSAAQRVSLERR